MLQPDTLNLFESTSSQKENKNLPLAIRIRPETLDEFVGQEHILSKNSLLRRAIEIDRLNSLILYGPPGTGKTTLAFCIANKTKSHFEQINATYSNVEELRKIIAASKLRKNNLGKKTILFIDEIHRFNKAQQDVLLPDVEKENLVLIGATVHNPFFYLVSALLSRSLVFELNSLKEKDITQILERALKDSKKGLGKLKIKPDKNALDFLAKTCEGDARRALNALEIGSLTTPKSPDGFVHFNLEVAQESIQKKAVVYDHDEDNHYDNASAFIKSMRGSDPDAAIYYLAKMLYAGEDPRFVARRICICAAEDVGNADPQALVLAASALQVAEFVGMPEARIPLAQAAIYVACSPKSNASYLAVEQATKDVENKRVKEIPKYLKDASYEGAKTLGRGQGYKYPHEYKKGYVEQIYVPQIDKYYQPKDIGYETKIKKRLEELKKI